MCLYTCCILVFIVNTCICSWMTSCSKLYSVITKKTNVEITSRMFAYSLTCRRRPFSCQTCFKFFEAVFHRKKEKNKNKVQNNFDRVSVVIDFYLTLTVLSHVKMKYKSFKTETLSTCFIKHFRQFYFKIYK